MINKQYITHNNYYTIYIIKLTWGGKPQEKAGKMEDYKSYYTECIVIDNNEAVIEKSTVDAKDIEDAISILKESLKQGGYIFIKILKIEENINPNDYTIEYCPGCETEQVIFNDGITICPDCGKLLLPCGNCEVCNYDKCPNVMNEPIPKELAKKILKLLK